MAKFAIECPKCGSINTASNFIFAKKVIKCGTCHEEIDTKVSRLTSKVCPHCGKVFVYDQAKSRRKDCPSCGKTIINVATAATAEYKMKKLNCPQCSCTIEVNESLETTDCPICDCKIDIKKELLKAQLVTDGGVSVIQYEGDNSTFVWKHPIEDFNYGSQLIVHESQEAIFFLNGEALDSFGPGRYSLETESLPILKKIYTMPTGKQTPFHAEVYFINKTVQMGMKWGTDSRVRFIDPVTGIPLDIGASGELNLQVSDGRRLLVKLVGTTGGLSNKQVLSGGVVAAHKTVLGQTNQDLGTQALKGEQYVRNYENTHITSNEAYRTLQSFFRAPLMTVVKSHLASTIKEQKINILEIDEKMGDLSEALRGKVAEQFEEYGLTVPQFYITNIVLPEEDKNFQSIRALLSTAYIKVKEEEVAASVAEAARQRKLIEGQTEAQLELLKAQTEAEKLRATGFAEADIMRAKGYTGKDELEAEVQKAYAAGIGNMGSGGGGSAGGSVASDMISMMAGMKMMEGLSDRIGSMVSPSGAPAAAAAAPAPAESGWTCSCGQAGNTGKFCAECGAPRPDAWTCSCGHSGNKGKFCEECGAPKPTSWKCECGHDGNTGKFCAECGAKKPE